ncbi:MAG: DUF952 domain-containing protein [Chloroflexi bacterium]|nr:DUF952 domain-containing protein [Chloroflexota bacterium]
MPAVTYHLVAEPSYQSCDPAEAYTPESFADDGFIHCSDGVENVIATANRYYKDDTREYLALVINVDKVTAPVEYEDPRRIFPHIYGPLNRDAIASALPVKRDPDGTFTALELPKPG